MESVLIFSWLVSKLETSVCGKEISIQQWDRVQQEIFKPH